MEDVIRLCLADLDTKTLMVIRNNLENEKHLALYRAEFNKICYEINHRTAMESFRSSVRKGKQG